MRQKQGTALFPPSLTTLFREAAEHHRRGDHAAAERACHEMLELAPLHDGANYLLGIIALQRGEFDLAVTRIRLALQSNSNVASAHRHLGVALLRLGRHEEALLSFEHAIALNAKDPESFAQRGNALRQLDRFGDAIADYDRALALKPDFAVVWSNRGFTLNSLDRLDEALASVDKALAIDPEYGGAHNLRGIVLHNLKRPEDALASYDRAIALQHNDANVYLNRGAALHSLERYEDAASSYDRALMLKPEFATAWKVRGDSMKCMGRYEEALASYDRAIALEPDFAEAFYDRGVVLMELKRPDDAIASYDRAVALKPDYPEAVASRGMCKLALAHTKEGWREHEYRWQVKTHSALDAPAGTPLWQGEDLRGRSILVCSEGGLGDVVQFSRYLPVLAQQGAAVSFQVPEKMHALLAGLTGGIRLIAQASANDRFDFCCPAMGVPARLEDDPNIPFPTPYLSIDAARAERWRKQLGDSGFKIGIVWQGTPWRGGTAGIAGRGIPLSEFYSLAQIPSVRLISLQKNDGIDQLSSLPPGMHVETLGDEFDAGPQAFADTAALMPSLDLVITCDTSIAHVAGALGRPTWMALQFVPDWRWLLEGTASPWYPTVRLFRQPKRGDWRSVFSEMAAKLTRLVP